ncbi:hypothetical protein [Laspinema palackyanum]|uniref:hypothetical protein n=1 Tax=Laspinema palackyanum TaxID=3231601 RepID=UPI00345DC977|nr:hypothetical protein [Laspinema sp. D2c]
MDPKPTEAGDRLFAPNLYVFAYSLREDAEGKINPLWQYGDNILHHFTEKTLIPNLVFPENGTSNRSDLLTDVSLHFLPEKSPQIEGFAQPQQLQDSYVLWLNVGYSDEDDTAETVPVQVLSKFNPNDVLTLPNSDQLLGQTLLITAWLTTKTKPKDVKFLRNIADQCGQSLLGKAAPPFYRAGELFDSPIFEYGKPSLSLHPPLLIWLFYSKTADNQYDNCQQELIALLLYRTKIVKAFHDSRVVYAKLDTDYGQIEQKLDDLQKKLDSTDALTSDQDLDSFKSQLKGFARDSLQYTRLLRKMEDFANTIEINLYNYLETIDEICAKLGIDKEELSFLKHFGENTAPHFRRQIKADLGYFEHGTELMDQAIASIRGIVEIDQAKSDRLRLEQEKQRDRHLETLIYVISAGLAGAGIAASSSGYLTAGSETGEMTIQWIPDFNKPLHPFTKVLGISIAIGVLLGLLVWLIRRGIQSFAEKRG